MPGLYEKNTCASKKVSDPLKMYIRISLCINLACAMIKIKQ